MSYLVSSPLNPLKGKFTHNQLSDYIKVITPLRGSGVRNTTESQDL